MKWDDVLKIALTTITSLGGISGIFILAVKFSSNIIAEQLKRKYELQLTKEIESYKSVLDKKNYVSKVRFDTEFALYRELIASCGKMVNETYFVYPTYANVPADESDRKDYEDKVYSAAIKSISEFSTQIRANSPFIPKEFYNNFSEIRDLCAKNTDVYAFRWNKGFIGNWETSAEKRSSESEAYHRTDDFKKKFEKITDDIRDYLNKLDVI